MSDFAPTHDAEKTPPNHPLDARRPIMFSSFQETPFDTQGLEFCLYFFPFIVTATIPTLLAVGWKNVNPNRVLTDEQFWLSTCYVQVSRGRMLEDLALQLRCLRFSVKSTC